jgi:hypothetical protein
MTVQMMVLLAAPLIGALSAAAGDALLLSEIFDGGSGGTRVPGPRGTALWFWGEREQGVTVPGSAAIAAADEMTVGAWIWVWRIGDHQTLVWKGDRKPAIDRVQFRLAIRPEGHLEFTFKGSADEWYQLIAPAPLPVGRWVYVAAGFNRGQATLDVDGRRVAVGRMQTYGIPAEAWRGDRLLLNDAPVEIGAGQEAVGEPGQFFVGAIGEVCLWAKAFPAPLPCADVSEGSPLAALTLFEKTFAAAEIREKPWLVGRAGNGREPWMLTVEFPGAGRSVVRMQGMAVPVADGTAGGDGAFRYLLDDYCGPIDLRGAEGVRVCGYRLGGARPAPSGGAGVALQADDTTARVVVQAGAPQAQTLRGFGCYADLPRTVPDDPAEREQAWGPVLDALREAGVTQLDFSFSTELLEPTNDDADPSHIAWGPLRQTFATSKALRTLSAYLSFVQARGFAVGLRAISFAGWQWKGTGAGRVPDADEVAESCVALLLLLREEGLAFTHLVPVWEPAYPPEAVAEVCARTAKLARRHGLDLPVVGPYRIATGGQSIDMDAMPDRYLSGQRYVSAYLQAMEDLGAVVGVEDYASGWAEAETNLIRLRREVIEPFGTIAGRPRELWLLEYGPLCGIGPWNFYPSRWHGAYAGYASAFRLARMTHQALNAGVNNFYFWKAYDTVGDGANISSFGLVKGDAHDLERRPPYHAARVLWRHVPRGARHVACAADGGVIASACETDEGLTVLLTNPRSCAMTLELQLPPRRWAPVGQVFGTHETVTYQEREVTLKGSAGTRFEVPPRSVSALVCRVERGTAPYARTVWPSDGNGVDYLSDLQWDAVSVAGQEALMREPKSGRKVTVHQDGTPACGWLTIAGARYRKGLGTVTPSTVVYALDGRHGELRAMIGVDDATRKMTAEENVVFAVHADGKQVFGSGPVKAGQAAVPVCIAITGAKTLRLTATGAKGVTADWADAFVVSPPVADGIARGTEKGGGK